MRNRLIVRLGFDLKLLLLSDGTADRISVFTLPVFVAVLSSAAAKEYRLAGGIIALLLS